MDDVSKRPGAPGAGSPSSLHVVVAEAVRATAADGDDRLSRLAVAAAVEEVLALDPGGSGAWYLAGFAEGFGCWEQTAPAPVSAERHLLVGRIHAAGERGDTEALLELVRSHRELARDLVASEALGAAATPLLLALLRHDAVAAARLAAAAPLPFARWTELLAVVRRRTTAMRRARNQAEAAAVLDGVGAMLERWTEARLTLVAVRHARARVALDRAAVRREAGDPQGASELLEAVDEDDLPDDERAELWTEAALAHLGVARIEELPLPSAGDGAPARPSVRADHAVRRCVSVALAVAPDDPVARLLAGVLAGADGDVQRAAAHLAHAAKHLGSRVSGAFRETVARHAAALRATED